MPILTLHYKSKPLLKSNKQSITMKFSYSLSNRSFPPILAIQFLIIHSVSSLNLTNEYLNHKCILNQGKYNSGSQYEDNLNWIFREIRTGLYAITGFSHISVGKTTTDFVVVTSQCRGDTYESNCRTCIDTAIAGVNELSYI